MQVIPIPQLSDNYAYLVIDQGTRKAGVVDCAEAEPVLSKVRETGVDLVAILPTHHHWDHIGGIATRSTPVSRTLRSTGSASAQSTMPAFRVSWSITR